MAEVLVTVSDYAPPGFRTKVCHMGLRCQEGVSPSLTQVTVSAKQKLSNRAGGGSHHTDITFFFTVVGGQGFGPHYRTGGGWPGAS